MWVLHLVFVLGSWSGEGPLPSTDRFVPFATYAECRAEQLAWVEHADIAAHAEPRDVPAGYVLLNPPLECKQAELVS